MSRYNKSLYSLIKKYKHQDHPSINLKHKFNHHQESILTNIQIQIINMYKIFNNK